MNYLVRAGLAATILTLSACASVAMAPKEWDLTAKKLDPPPLDRAHVYVYRDQRLGADIKMQLLLDGDFAGETAAKTFTLLPVRPGKHLLISEPENPSHLSFYASPGATVFVWQEVEFRVFRTPKSKLRLVDSGQGRVGVLRCELIAAPPPPMPPLPPAP
jgi:hypothetical protein